MIEIVILRITKNGRKEGKKGAREKGSDGEGERNTKSCS